MTTPNGVPATRQPIDGHRATVQVAVVFGAATAIDIAVRHVWGALHGGPATGPIDLVVTALVATAITGMHVLLAGVFGLGGTQGPPVAHHRWLRRAIAGITVGTSAFAVGALTSSLLQHRQIAGMPVLATLASATMVAAAAASAAAWFATAEQFAARARTGLTGLASFRNALATLVIIASVFVSALPWLMALNAEESARDETTLEAIRANLRAQDEQLARLRSTMVTGAPDAALLASIARQQRHVDALATAYAAQHNIDPAWQAQWARGESLQAASAAFAAAARDMAQPRAGGDPGAATTVSAAPRLLDAARDYRLATQRAGNVADRMLKRARQDLATYRKWRAISAPAIGFLLTLGFAAPWLGLIRAHIDTLQRQSRVLARAANAMLLTDRDWRITWVNPAFEALTGFAAARARGQLPCSLLAAPETAPDAVQRIIAAFNARRSFDETVQTRTADGRTYWAHVDMQAMLDDAGQPDGFCMVIRDVTEAKQAEAERQHHEHALAESEERFRRLADEASDLIVTADFDGTVLYASHAATRLGYRVEDLTGQNVFAFIHPDDRTGVLERRQLMHAGAHPGPLAQRIYRVRDAWGRWIWMESSPNLFAGPDGQPMGITVYLRDIDARKAAEESLQEHVAILDSIAEVSGVGGWSLNLATGTKHWTAQTRRIYGVQDDYDPRLAQDLDFYPEEARARVLDAISAATADGTPWDLEVPFVNAAGQQIWVRTAGRARWDDGKVVSLYGSFADVTEERNARQRLIDANEEARNALGALSSYQAALDRHAIVSMTDADGTIYFVNDRFCEVTGYAREELIGANHRLLRSGVHPPALFADMWRTMSSGASWRGEMCNRAKDGSLHWLDTTIVPVCNADGVPERYVSIRYDLTEQKALEARNAREARIRDGITRVQSTFITSGLADAMREALTLTLEAGESAYGFIGEVRHEHGKPWLLTHAITDISWDESSREMFAQQQTSGLEFRNLASLFGAALVTGEPVIANDAPNDPRAGGLPPGHPPLRAFLGVPIRVHGELVAMVGIANRPQGYDAEVIASLQAVLDAVGQLVRSARERTARAAAETALILERQRLADVIQGTGVGIWSWDLPTDGVWFNDRWSEILGYPHDALATWRASDWFDGYHPEDLEAATRATRATFEGAADGIDVEVRMRHAEGHWVWLHLRGSVSSHDATGKPLVLSGMAQDISERKHGERMRALINEQLGVAKEHAVRKGQEEAALAELLRLGLADTDIPTFLDAALATTLTSIDWLRELPGACIELQADDDGTPAPGTIAWRAPFVPQPVEPRRHAVPLRDGDRTLGALHVVLAEGGQPEGDAQLFLERVAAVLVTGIRHRDAARRLREAAVAAQSASIAKSQFLATMSHEIRTPMNGVLGTLDLLLGTPLDAGQREWATIAHDSAQQLLQLLNEILDFSRLEANQVKLEQLPVAPGDLLQRVLSLHLAQAREKGIRITRDIDAGTPAWVLGDATRLQQVLMNLVGNAVKFTDLGEVAIAVRHDGTHLRVEVRDTGIGIASEAQARLFNRFVQADSSITRRYGGTGLGLAICSQLVRAMGGEIGVQSRPGEGSLFWFSVPAAVCIAPSSCTDDADEHVAAPPATPQANALRVLVAEDNPVNQRIMRAFLEAAGHRVTLVDDGAQAIDAHARAPFDIVLMDVQMPVMDGLSATTALRALPGDAGAVPIIAITANAMPGDREHYLAVGMDGYVSKPINRHSLAASIAAAMQVAHRGARD